ncbi:hypothetical protein A9Q78_08515 [Methylophaga sp. 41_12_T18]|nr:hypothetical protein A9Q78_08515 [Methylophaga sp. 41_12_T18]
MTLKKLTLSLGLILNTSLIVADEVEIPQSFLAIEAMSVTAQRLQASTLLSAHTVHTIDQAELEQKQPRNLPEALNQLPGVMIQKTANGQGSPFIRGFTGYRTLALIDGVRYNNSVYRDGPNEYFSLIDVSSLSSIELLSGPSSALYGSDAIGGALNLQTQSTNFISENSGIFFTHGSQSLRYSTAENSFISRTELDLGQGQQWGLHAGYSRKNFGDVEAADIGTLDHTGYDEYGLDLRLDVILSSQWDLTLVHQNLNQDDVWRTHSTIYSESFSGSDIGSDLRRLKDQERQLNYLKLTGYDLNEYIDEATLTLSHQRWQEQGDRIKDSGKRILDYFDSNMVGIDLQLESHFKDIAFTYGFDYYLDKVDSGRTDYLADGSIDQVRIQGPVGDDSEFAIFGSYVQAQFELSPKLSVNLSTRFSYVDADIGRYEDPITNSAASYQDDWTNLSSAVRASYQYSESTSMWAGISQSFRAPNIADLSRYGKSRSTETEVAATGLSPETFLTYETGFKFKRDALQIAGTYYYTQIDDFIASTPTGNIVGGLIEVSKQNSADGYIHGVELELNYQVNSNISSHIDFTWLEGRLTRDSYINSFTEVTEPFSRIMPMTAHISLEWQSDNKDKWIGTDLTLAAKADKLSEGDKADTQRIPPGGTPSYQLVNIYSGWQANTNLMLTLQLNNIFDEAYRSHGSGSNEPGRNLVLGMKASF